MKEVMKQITKTMPGVGFIIDSKTYKRLRHRVSLIKDDRENSTFTGFYRLPTQFEALTGPVLQFLFNGKTKKQLDIIVFGCSNGSEPFTIASVLNSAHKDLDFKIYALDIDEEILEKARRACYVPDEEIYNNKIISESFIEQTFNKGHPCYPIKDEIAARVTFQIANVLEPGLADKYRPVDILFAQNFLFHLKPEISKRALQNLYKLLKSRSALFIDGVDLNQRVKFTKRMNLNPLDYKIEEIHVEARRARSVGWPYSYWGLEPFMTTGKDWKRRYATIFLKGEESQ